MGLKHLFIFLLLIATPIAFADHQRCNSNDCPLWLRGQGYATPIDNSHNSNYWHDDTTTFVYQDVYHPPKHYYVHYNQNYHRTYGNTGYNRYNSYQNTRYYNRGYSYNDYTYNQRPSRSILYGNGFSRYY